jgi:hypothetical protein
MEDDLFELAEEEKAPEALVPLHCFILYDASDPAFLLSANAIEQVYKQQKNTVVQCVASSQSALKLLRVHQRVLVHYIGHGINKGNPYPHIAATSGPPLYLGKMHDACSRFVTLIVIYDCCNVLESEAEVQRQFQFPGVEPLTSATGYICIMSSKVGRPSYYLSKGQTMFSHAFQYASSSMQLSVASFCSSLDQNLRTILRNHRQPDSDSVIFCESGTEKANIREMTLAARPDAPSFVSHEQLGAFFFSSRLRVAEAFFVAFVAPLVEDDSERSHAFVYTVECWETYEPLLRVMEPAAVAAAILAGAKKVAFEEPRAKKSRGGQTGE